jgi:hypothetical protein
MRAVNFYGAKGGQGVTVSACLAGISWAWSGLSVVIVSADDDAAAVLGLGRLDVHGSVDVDVAGLDGRPGRLQLVRADVVGETWLGDGVDVVIYDGWPAGHGCTDLLVTQCDYLALSRFTRSGVVPSGVVVVAEPGRALSVRDVAAVIDRPVVATLERSQAIARQVDAGVLRVRRSPFPSVECVQGLPMGKLDKLDGCWTDGVES